MEQEKGDKMKATDMSIDEFMKLASSHLKEGSIAYVSPAEVSDLNKPVQPSKETKNKNKM